MIGSRLYIDLPLHTSLNFTGRWHTSYFSPDEHSITLKVEPESDVAEYKSRLKLDIILEKGFFNEKMSVRAWIRNLLAGQGYVESFDPFLTAYPHIVHRTFGGSVSYHF